MIGSYIKTYTLTTSTIPVIMDEENVLSAIRAFSGIHIVELNECSTGNIHNISLYTKDPELKHWSVLDARRFIAEISEKPYSGKAMYIIQDFDEATPEAMNALLKVLEEPPEYAIIILIAKNPEAIIETIRSRTITLFDGTKIQPISEEWKEAIQSYFIGNDIGPVFRILSHEKLTQDEGLSLLLYASRHANHNMYDRIEKGILDIFGVNEPLKNILDRVFI